MTMTEFAAQNINMKKSDLAKKMSEVFGCEKSNAYRAIRKAEGVKTVQNKTSGKMSLTDFRRENDYETKLMNFIKKNFDDDSYYDESSISNETGIPVFKLRLLKDFDEFSPYVWPCTIHKKTYWALPEVLEQMQTALLEG